MGSFSVWHWLIVLAIVLLVFGTGRISGVMGDMAKGIKNFKKGLADDETDTADAAKKVIDGGATAGVAANEAARGEKI